jgi:hypothetical protein
VFRVPKFLITIVATCSLLTFLAISPSPAPLPAGLAGPRYQVLDPLTQDNLTVFPVVTGSMHDTSAFLTLDEGLRTGEVIVTEAGRVEPLLRRLVHPFYYPESDGAEVNHLVLENRSSRPLIMLAGEIVTGGKQDRVVAKDRIVPPKSGPLDLSVFCVDPGRWTARGDFASDAAPIAQPSVRREVLVGQDQGTVWASVRQSVAGAAKAVPAPEAMQLRATSSYAAAMDHIGVQKQVDHIAAPIERSYEKLERQLRAEQAVGVVAAVNGQIIWADVFASPELFNQYWPKLVRSYAAEAVTCEHRQGHVDVKSAQAFLDEDAGRRETVETEPGVYRRSEVSGDGFTAFTLTSLLPHTGFALHAAKVAD